MTGACHLCGVPFSWRGPSPVTGRVQGWYRHHTTTAKGPRCADRGACKARRAGISAVHDHRRPTDPQLTLFEEPT